MNQYVHHIPRQLDAVDPAVIALKSEVAKQLSDEVRFRFELCVIEALTNLVTHAQGQTLDDVIEIRMDLKDGHVKIELFDPSGAEPFDPCSSAKDISEIDGMAEGGRGIGLIMELADTAAYGPSDNRNSLKLEFWDAGQQAAQQLSSGAKNE